MFSYKRSHQLIRNLLGITVPSSSPSSANISTGCVLNQANYYEALGISKKSTQEEIKAAYYRLSMLYHPDKNQGSESAAVKFREITQAYEVLGNFKLRRLYDKGIIHTAGSKYAQRGEDTTVYDTAPEPDDPETKFYKSRFTKSKVSDPEGRSPIYNFDEWSRQHYGTTFERRKAAKAKYERQEKRSRDQKLMTQNEILLFGILIIGCLIYTQFIVESSYDTPKARAERRAAEKKLKEEHTKN